MVFGERILTVKMLHERLSELIQEGYGDGVIFDHQANEIVNISYSQDANGFYKIIILD